MSENQVSKPDAGRAAWIILIVSGVLEAVWAHALGQITGLDAIGPIVIFALAVIGSMVGLAWAMRTIPTSIAYAVWTGIGASLAVVWGMASGAEPVSWVRIALIAVLIMCVMGLHGEED